MLSSLSGRFRLWPVLASAIITLWQLSGLASPGSDQHTGVPRALILSSGDSGEGRDSTAFLRRVLEESGHFDTRICEATSGLTVDAFSGFDVVVNNRSGGSLGRTTEKALAEFVDGGKGLVITRAALAAIGDEPSSPLAKLSGLTHAVRGSGAPPFQLFNIEPVTLEHPIMAGVHSPVRTADVPFTDLVVGAHAETLARSHDGAPILFAAHHGKGRVFCTALGRDVGAMEEAAFITAFLRGTEWAALGKVAVAAEISTPGPAADGLRVLVVNGGHDHYTSFYGLFDGYRDIGRPAVADSKLAFQQDIRSKYDVLVFYDFTRDLDDKEKKNLRDFVESNKGIVLLHHAILDFQKWPWWYEEVAGGLYRLERQGSVPNSTVKYGEEHMIMAAATHPITDGITPFHVTDETYKGLFISDRITPLLVTDNPTSDRTVAWIGPCKTSRVVFIQLGHDHLPFQHPSYRALVHNSILWTAGRLK